MKRVLLAYFFLIISCVVVFAEDKKIPVVVDGDEINYLQQEGKIIARGNVRMQYKDVELFCEEAHYDANANTANIKGDVKIIRSGSTVYGKDVVFDFNTLEAKMEHMRIEDAPFYGEAGEVKKLGQDEYLLHDGYVTTCDLDEPHYRLVAKSITVYPGEKVVAKNIVLMVGKIPVFYIPYFSQSLKDKSFPVEVIPGKNSEWGYYLLTRWRYAMDSGQRGKINLDWYEARGQGYGVTHKVETKNFGEALVKYYRIEDDLYNLQDRSELFERYPQRQGIPGKRLEDDRYKAQFYYEWQPTADVSVKAEVNKFSDEFFMKDFFRREYDIEPQAKTYALINYSLPYSSLSLRAQKQVNRFFTETEYLPQLEYNFYPQNIGASKFYIASRNTAGLLHYKPANIGIDEEASRIYSNNTLSYVDKIAWLYINSYVGAENAFYSRDRFGQDEQWRFAPRAGVTFSTKLSKLFESDWYMFGQAIDATRHIITPELSYDYRRKPNISNSSLYQFDEIDDIAREEKVTFALKNKLQAKNEDHSWDFLFFSPSLEYQLNQENKGSYFSSVKADLEFYPKKGLAFTSRTNYSLLNDQLAELNADITASGRKKVMLYGKEVEQESYAISLGHRYTFEEAHQGLLNFNYQISPKLQFRNYTRYIYDTGDFQQQQYAFRQDLHCWWMDVGLNVDRHSTGGKDFTFWVAFTLKAFPDVSFNLDQTYDGAKSNY